MSLSTWEQQAPNSIKDHLASCDPALVARLTIFTRLASGEEMPTREKIHVGSWRAVRRSRPEPRPTRRAYQRLGLQQAVLLLWLVTTVRSSRSRWPATTARPRHMHGILGNVLHRCDIRTQFGSRAFPEYRPCSRCHLGSG
jgi:hypothetical protein